MGSGRQRSRLCGRCLRSENIRITCVMNVKDNAPPALEPGKNRSKKIAVILLAILVVPMAIAVYQSRFAFHQQGAGGGLAVESISLVNLIATPEKYHGKWIRVEGVCAFEFEGNAVYLSTEDRRHMLTKNAVWASYDTLGA